MIENIDSIKKSLTNLLSKSCVKPGNLRPHNIGMLVLLWIIMLIIGITNYYFDQSLLTVCVTLCCFLFLLKGTMIFKKNDYMWYKYYFYNTCGFGLMIMYDTIRSSLEWGYTYLIFATCILLVFITISGFVAFKKISNKIINGEIKPKDESTYTETSIFVPVSGVVGVLLYKILPDKTSLIIIMAFIGILIGSVCVLTLTIYSYGKKYDPDCELLKWKQIESDSEENSISS